MVKKNKRMFRSKFAISALCVGIASFSVAYADGFYTIIGPDGRPMIVPSKEIKQKKQSISKIETPTQILPNKTTVISTQKVSEENKKIVLPKNVEQKEQKKLNTAPTAPTAPTALKDTNESDISVSELNVPVTKPKSLEKEKFQSVPNDEWKKKLVSPPVRSSSQDPSSLDFLKDKSKFATIDGVEYVNNEYLEDQEFNIEGKKRFYIMPDGLGRTESVERKKGVSHSTLDQLFNRHTQDDQSAVVLSPIYMRLSPQDLESAFEQDKCFIEGYTKSIKTLSINKEVNLWPRRPLKEKFEYEVVQLNPSIQHLKFTSFAASNEKPVYYWPLVVFLNDKGCILEGASGFKSKSYPSTILQHASMQGILKVPPSAKYIMLTPLSSAVDVEEKDLTNQGQVQISVLR
ncbi:putative pilus assembly protein FilE [Acinetobacter pittii]|uniref:putative pilus assembly protein FilE n=1 Tax=Acinetobacter pittii TaxID=48296 RepID=UPI001EFCFC81|nr:putative pilus assembly protein FilE [Acinetobacter pittii]MCG9513452.1 putative pilus assembly protein FilE [Acinetobacter pittii]